MPMTASEAGKLGAIASRPISHAQKQIRIEAYKLNPEQCVECKKVLDYDLVIQKKSALKAGRIRNLFCGSSCSAAYNNKHRVRKTYKKCDCGKLTTYESCSKACAGQSRWQKTKELIEAGKISDNSRKTLKKYVLERDGFKCSICKIETWMNQKAPLVLDHIDGNYQNCFPSNLRLVCGNCNMQLPTFGGKNKGNGRFARRERYRQGKSC